MKSQSVLDPFGGSQPSPGRRHHVPDRRDGDRYRRSARNAALRDAIPTDTTYVVGSLRLNGAPLTDGADADAGAFVLAPTPGVTVSLGDLTAAAGPQTINFQVTID